MSIHNEFYIGLMTGTSLDRIDGVLVSLTSDGSYIGTLASTNVDFPPALRADFIRLQQPSAGELECEAMAANSLAKLYSTCVDALLLKAGLPREAIRAIGAHGQTIRHRPEMGYTRQSGNLALLAEMTGIDVIGDFRSRDVAAGGQGAPLVPACHASLFGAPDVVRCIVNIGGVSNLSILRPAGVVGFDTGPGNILLDIWAARHLGQPYDRNGDWAATGIVIPALLQELRNDMFFHSVPPKSTGRDLFNLRWIAQKLGKFQNAKPEDVQATLVALTASTIACDISAYGPDVREVYLCGGGAYNAALVSAINSEVLSKLPASRVASTESLGVPPMEVEALSFAWLSQRFVQRKTGSLAAVTGARANRVLGALYPA